VTAIVLLLRASNQRQSPLPRTPELETCSSEGAGSATRSGRGFAAGPTGGGAVALLSTAARRVL
jgi:hypothetical protein